VAVNKLFHPLQQQKYIEAGEYLDKIQENLNELEVSFVCILKEIDFHFPGSIAGNDQSSEKDLLKILNYELVHIFESYLCDF